MIAAGSKGGRETLDPSKMHHPKIDVYNTVE
jgi:hypothetical protein